MRGDRVRGNKRGTVLLFMLVTLLFLFVFGGFAIDFSFLSVVKSELQRSMDAAALAGVGNLGFNDSVFAMVRQEAWRFADLNPARVGAINLDQNPGNDPNGDIVLGIWEGGSFMPSLDGPLVNAVRVRYATEVPTSFLGILGFNTLPVSAEAIAIRARGDCFDRGIVAGNQVTAGEDFAVLPGASTCVYGRNGASFGQRALLSEDSRIGALDETTITFGEHSVVPEGVLFESDRQPTLAQSVADIIDSLENGSFSPPQISNVVVGTSLPSPLVAGTAYIVNGDVTIDEDIQVADVIIAARGNVIWGENGAITNTGDPSTGALAVGILATGDINMGERGMVVGAELIAGHDVHIQQDGVVGSIQAVNNVFLDERVQSSPFATSLPGFGSGSGSSGSFRLVR